MNKPLAGWIRKGVLEAHIYYQNGLNNCIIDIKEILQDHNEIFFRVNRNSTIFSATSPSQISSEEIPIRYEKKFENFLWTIFKGLTKKYPRKKKRRTTLTIRTLNLGCETLLSILMFFSKDPSIKSYTIL